MKQLLKRLLNQSPQQFLVRSSKRSACKTLVNAVTLAAAAIALPLSMQSTAVSQTNSLIPRFTNSITAPPRTASPSVNMKLADHARRSAQVVREKYGVAPDRLKNPRSLLLPVRYRRQDGDVFGEDQAGGAENPFGEPTVESPIKESPFSRPKLPQPRQTPQPRTTQPRVPQDNPFGTFEEPTRTPPTPPQVDPSPRVPPMDTVPVEPRLPPGSEFTPDPSTVPGNMPMPDGRSRDGEKARTEQSRTPDPDEIGIEDFVEDPLDGIEDEDPDARRPTRVREREEPDFYDRRRPFRSNVYRPAKEPSYYSASEGQRRQNPYQDPAYPYANPYAPGANPYAPGANPYAPGANPYALGAPPYPNPYAVNPYAMNPYAANPYPVAPYPVAPYPYAGYGCPPSCCNGCPPNNCGCPSCPQPSPANNYAGCPTPTPATGSEGGVYENVIGDGLGLGLASGGGLNDPFATSGLSLFYVSLFGGWTDLSDLEIVNESGTINLDSDDGLGLGFAIGQIQGKNLRSELEFSYRNNDFEDFLLNDNLGSLESISSVGDIESFAGMLNVYWEFVDLCNGRLSPYIGVGVGAVNVSADSRLDGAEDAFADGEDSSFAYQYIVGINYKLRPHSDLFVEFRHFAADSLRFDTSLPAGSLLDGDGELNYQTNNIFFGTRLKF